MVIRSVETRHLRGIRVGKLADLTPLVVLVGPNGSGKSTVLEAIFLGASMAPGEAISRVVQRHQGVRRGARWLFWKGDESGLSSIIVTGDKGQRTCEIRSATTGRLENEVGIRYTVNQSNIATVTFVGNDLNAERITRHAEVTPVNGVQDVRFVEVHTDYLQPPLHQLFTRVVEQGRREQAREVIGELLPGFVSLEILTEGDAPILHLVYEDRSVPVVLAGDGVQSLVRLSLELAARPQGVVLVEEPELYQHPGAIRQSARAILAAVRRDIQVILTTHSLDLIDSLLSESTIKGPADLDKLSLYRTALKDGRLLATRYSGTEVASARGAIQDDLR
jgi:predicted ATPase